MPFWPDCFVDRLVEQIAVLLVFVLITLLRPRGTHCTQFLVWETTHGPALFCHTILYDSRSEFDNLFGRGATSIPLGSATYASIRYCDHLLDLTFKCPVISSGVLLKCVRYVVGERFSCPECTVREHPFPSSSSAFYSSAFTSFSCMLHKYEVMPEVVLVNGE